MNDEGTDSVFGHIETSLALKLDITPVVGKLFGIADLARAIEDKRTAIGQLVHHFWLCAQHEENPASPHGSYLDYFAKEVIEDAKKKPSQATINEGLQALKDFLNAMPRWCLSGYAPEEIQDGAEKLPAASKKR